MERKGFTLIELLAVIVILAIVALIAIPIVMNVIENSKKRAAERSAENYIDAVETAVATERLKDGTILQGNYDIQGDGNLCEEGTPCTDETEIKIEMNGNKPTGGTVIIENGQVVPSLSSDAEKKTSLSMGSGYTVSYDESKNSFIATKNEEDNELTIYRFSPLQGILPYTLGVGSTVDLDNLNYEIEPENLGSKIYLKYVLDKNNEITESYVCAKFTTKEACLRTGRVDYSEYNRSILNSLNSEEITCQTDEDGYLYCNDEYVELGLHLGGAVIASQANYYCNGDGHTIGGGTRCGEHY